MKINVITLDYTRKELIVQFDNVEDMRNIANTILNSDDVDKNAMAKYLGLVDTKNDMDSQILGHINRGNRIDAIRYHRQVTGSLLKQSEEYCDQIGVNVGVLVYVNGVVVYKDSPAARGYSDYEGDRP